jgi:hypothetical protein
MTKDFPEVWSAIVALAGETFRQKRGQPFTYVVTGSTLRPNTTNRNLTKGQFEKAFLRLPIDGPGGLQDLQGPSYLYAILTDPRIAS